jgi:hypothetical protein
MVKDKRLGYFRLGKKQLQSYATNRNIGHPAAAQRLPGRTLIPGHSGCRSGDKRTNPVLLHVTNPFFEPLIALFSHYPAVFILRHTSNPGSSEPMRIVPFESGKASPI